VVDRLLGRGRDGRDGREPRDGRDAEDARDAREEPPTVAAAEPAVAADARAAMWARVQLARNLRRPRILELLAVMADEFIELHGDRLFGDDEAIVAGFASIDGRRVVVIGQQKGADTEENVRRNFGMPHPEGYRKAMRVMELAERCGLPVVTFVDVPGAHPGPESEERGIAEAIARSVGLMTRLRTPIVAVITGEGGSGGALAIAIGDVVLALENAVYSVITPEGCASILWRTPDEAPAAALAMRMSAGDQRALGIVDQVIAEPEDGAHTDHQETGRRLKDVIVRELDRLAAIPTDLLVEQRYRRYRAIGAYTEIAGPVPIPPVTPRTGLADRLRGLLEAGQRAIPAPLQVGRRDEPPAREDV
jgi:acetyl-CoA carboxylase carboxyl transferase subunit alpha